MLLVSFLFRRNRCMKHAKTLKSSLPVQLKLQLVRPQPFQAEMSGLFRCLCSNPDLGECFYC